ncbi:hypothetical protein VPH35_070359 [Triticum aestivum]|uniref:uncharacterized protein n=1 Tax=Triticum aestivum TaxID=4565 RepID=UPI00162D16C2|nr:uncharacterized protein LOC123088522 [Triticum aestivum]
MALRTLAARVRTSSAAVRLQAPAVGISPPPGGRPNLHSAAAATRRLSPPSGGRPPITLSRNLGSSPREDAARKMVLETAATLEHLEKTYETFKARVGLLEKAATFLKWSWACIIPVPLVYAIAQHY